MPRYFAPGNYLIASNSSSLEITGTQLTIHLWAYFFSHGGLADILNKWGSQPQYLMRINNGYLDAYVSDSGGWDEVGAPGSFPVPLNTWVSLAMVKSGTTMRIHQDGKKLNEGYSGRTIYASGGNVVVGTNDVIIAHPAIWAEALDEADILRLAQGELPSRVQPSQLRAYWPLNDYGPSGVSRDLSGYNNTLAIGSGTIALQPNDPPAIAINNNTSAFILGTPDIPDDTATVYLDLTAGGSEIYEPGCFIIGDGEATLRWRAGDQQLRWLGYDANLRWDANVRIATAHC